MKMKDKVVLVIGASRGIGEAIALKCASEGACVAIAAKTVESNADPRLSGSIQTVAQEVQRLGGKALPLRLDVRDDNAIDQAVRQVVERWGALDIVIHNAGAIKRDRVADTQVKDWDLMMSVNTRAAFVLAHAAYPHLRRSSNPHVLHIAPPLSVNPMWYDKQVSYTTSKYALSLLTIGLAVEWAPENISVNALWPKTLIATSAVSVHFPALWKHSRWPKIMADAAYCLFNTSEKTTGKFLLDEDYLRQNGQQDFSSYAVDGTQKLAPDWFVDAADMQAFQSSFF